MTTEDKSFRSNTKQHESNRAMVDALREVLGLCPLYSSDKPTIPFTQYIDDGNRHVGRN